MLRKFKLKVLLWLLDSYLCKNDHYSNWLWSILTALRGPDTQDNLIKFCNTAIVRAVALPKCSQTHNLPATFNTVDKITNQHLAGTVSVHYAKHIGQAVDALRALGRRIK